MASILIVYCSYEYPLRTAVADHLYAFRRSGPHRCYYLNLGVRRPPAYLVSIPFDLVVYHTTFLSLRAWAPEIFLRLVSRARPLTRLSGVKVALPQDEFLNTDALCDFINEFGVDIVFSVMPASEWPKIYHRIDRTRTRLLRVLTGYLDEGTVSRIQRMAERSNGRGIDIGYRAWRGMPWLGRHGALKARIAGVFEERAPQVGLRTDISIRDEDAIVGDDWYEFLLRCKYTIGVEGGASILDRDGTIKAKTEAYLRDHPEATFEDVEGKCFPGIDGNARLVAISPRHLEACATRTCQVLIEGEYNGILKAGVHYIELKRDFSNLENVLEIIKRDAQRARITDRAYRDIVMSGQYTYRQFLNWVTEQSLPAAKACNITSAPNWIWRWAQAADALSWVLVWVRKTGYRLADKFPPRVREGIRRLKRAACLHSWPQSSH